MFSSGRSQCAITEAALSCHDRAVFRILLRRLRASWPLRCVTSTFHGGEAGSSGAVGSRSGLPTDQRRAAAAGAVTTLTHWDSGAAGVLR